MQAHAECNPLFRRSISLPCIDALLHLGGALEGVVDAFETGEKAVAGILHDRALRRGNHRLDDLPEYRHQPGMRLRIVLIHQPGISGNIVEQDCGKPALHNQPTEPPGHALPTKNSKAKTVNNGYTRT